MGRLQTAPELDPARGGVRGQIVLGHPKRIDLDADLLLPVLQRRFGQQVDLLHVVIGHGKASVRGAAAVNHDVAAGPAHGSVECVRVAQVESQVEVRMRMQSFGHDRIESLGRLEIALESLGPEHTGDVADWKRAVKFESFATPKIEFQFAAFLEYPDMHRVSYSQTLAIQTIGQPIALVDPGRFGGFAGGKSRIFGTRVCRHHSRIRYGFAQRGEDPFTVGADTEGCQDKDNSSRKGDSTHPQEFAKLRAFVQWCWPGAAARGRYDNERECTRCGDPGRLEAVRYPGDARNARTARAGCGKKKGPNWQSFRKLSLAGIRRGSISARGSAGVRTRGVQRLRAIFANQFPCPVPKPSGLAKSRVAAICTS